MLQFLRESILEKSAQITPLFWIIKKSKSHVDHVKSRLKNRHIYKFKESEKSLQKGFNLIPPC